MAHLFDLRQQKAACKIALCWRLICAIEWTIDRWWLLPYLGSDSDTDAGGVALGRATMDIYEFTTLRELRLAWFLLIDAYIPSNSTDSRMRS